jgi:hypothetical protein
MAQPPPTAVSERLGVLQCYRVKLYFSSILQTDCAIPFEIATL